MNGPRNTARKYAERRPVIDLNRAFWRLTTRRVGLTPDEAAQVIAEAFRRRAA